MNLLHRWVFMPIRWIPTATAIAAVLATSLASPHVAKAQGATINVSTSSDELNTSSNGKCSLREAVIAANTDTAVGGCPAGNGDDVINLPSGTFKITRSGTREDGGNTGDFDITASVTIVGAGRNTTTIDANKLDRIFHIQSGTVTVSNLSVRNGFPGKGESGGGIANSATLTLNSVSVSNNVAEIQTDPNGNYGGSAGGIFNGDYAALTLIKSSIRYNQAAVTGGGLVNGLDAFALIKESVVNDNRVDEGAGGGIANGGIVELLGSTLAGNSAYFGGGLYNYANAAIYDSAVVNNRARYAGGVDNQRNVEITRSTFSGNKATGGDGGAIRNYPGSLIITNSTFSGNAAAANGGAIWNGVNYPENSAADADLTRSLLVGSLAQASIPTDSAASDTRTAITNLNSVTIVNNTADQNSDGKGDGGGLFNVSYADGDRIRVANSIIANNQDRGSQAADCAGRISSKGYNLLRTTKGCIFSGGSGNKLNLDPKLGSLQYNGGPTQTHVLLSGSPAIDAANSATTGTTEYSCAAIDQRGVTRPRDGNDDGKKRCDMGALERQSASTNNADFYTPADTAP